MDLCRILTMQNSNHSTMEDKFGMNFSNFDTDSLFNSAHMGGLHLGMKRSAHDAGLDRGAMGLTSDEDEPVKKEDCWPWDSSGKDLKSAMQAKSKEEAKMHATSSRENIIHHQQTSIDDDPQHAPPSKTVLPNGKKTKGRVKIKMEFIDNKLRRYTTFSKRKTGIMKKAYELSTLTGTQVMLLVASETGHVYTFATRKLQPMITSDAGKALIQTCLNSPDPPPSSSSGASHPSHHDQRMSATGYEETELTYAVAEEEHKVRQMLYPPSAPSPLTPLSSSSPSAIYHHSPHPTHPNSVTHTSQPLVSPPSCSSPSSHHAAAAAAAAVSLALQSHHHHHHHNQYQHHSHPHSSPSPHLSPPISSPHHVSHHSMQSQPNVSTHSDHSGSLPGLHHHSPHIPPPPPPQTPLPPQSPLPPVLSPMGTPSPTSPYPGIPHHPHHHISAHSR